LAVAFVVLHHLNADTRSQNSRLVMKTQHSMKVPQTHFICQLLFFCHSPKHFWNDRKKFSHFS